MSRLTYCALRDLDRLPSRSSFQRSKSSGALAATTLNSGSEAVPRTIMVLPEGTFSTPRGV
jgi:hypothetical protein